MVTLMLSVCTTCRGRPQPHLTQTQRQQPPAVVSRSVHSLRLQQRLPGLGPEEPLSHCMPNLYIIRTIILLLWLVEGIANTCKLTPLLCLQNQCDRTRRPPRSDNLHPLCYHCTPKRNLQRLALATNPRNTCHNNENEQVALLLDV